MDDILTRVFAKIAESDIEESNTTSNGGEYNSKYAFGKGDKEADNERTRQGDKSSGFPNKTERGNTNFEIYERWQQQINEITSKKDAKAGSNSGIREFNACVTSINSYAVKINKCIKVMQYLKTSKNLKANNVWKSKMSLVHKISKELERAAIKFRNTVH